jgi:sec-independent protein translocase protein TatC
VSQAANVKPRDEDEEIEASRAPLIDHLTELRSRLVTSMVVLVVAFFGCFFFSRGIFAFLVEPFLTAVRAVHPEQAAEALTLYNTHALGFFFVQLQVALFAAIVVSFPILAYQLYAFIAPGLYRRERGAVAPFLIAAPVMFLAGCAFVFYVVMPMALQFALHQEITEGPVQVRYLPKVDEYLSLVMALILAFGLCFQLPVVLALLARVRMVRVSMLAKGRRYALVGIAIVAAVVTPPDPFSMMLMLVPMYLLYELSIGIVWLIERSQAKADAEGDVVTPAP